MKAAQKVRDYICSVLSICKSLPILQNARTTQTVLIMLIVIHKNMAYLNALAILVTLEMQLLKAVKVTIEKFMRKLFTFLGM